MLDLQVAMRFPQFVVDGPARSCTPDATGKQERRRTGLVWEEALLDHKLVPVVL